MVFGKRTSDSGKSKKPTERSNKNMKNKNLKVAGDRPMSEAFLNNFFKVFSAEQIYYFEDLYNELEPKLKRIGMSGEEFMKQVRDAYARYQEHKNLDPFTPMDKKARNYVSDFLTNSINNVYNNVIKKQD